MWTTARTFVTTGLVALTIAGTTLATASQAEAHNNFGRGLVAGIAGAVIGGALLASTAHFPAHAVAPQGYPPAGYLPRQPAAYDPACHIAWQQNSRGDMYRSRICD